MVEKQKTLLIGDKPAPPRKKGNGIVRAGILTILMGVGAGSLIKDYKDSRHVPGFYASIEELYENEGVVPLKDGHFKFRDNIYATTPVTILSWEANGGVYDTLNGAILRSSRPIRWWHAYKFTCTIRMENIE